MKQTFDDDEMLPEYDFSTGVRGKYAGRYHRGSNVVVLEPDVVALFPNAEAVNTALRSLARLQSARARRGTRATEAEAEAASQRR